MKISIIVVLVTMAIPLGAAEPTFSATPSGLRYTVTRAGQGERPQSGQVVIAHYTGRLEDGTVFDRSREKPVAFTLSKPAGPDGKGEIKRQVIAGWDEGFRLMRVGDRATFVIPSALAYGDKTRGKIPPNSTLCFEVELLDLKVAALADHLQELFTTSGLTVARARFVELKATGFIEYYVSEAQLNALGYRLLKEKPLEARVVLEWNTELFPASANVYDSLGEAVLQAGERNNARGLYLRSLELDPNNENARKMLAELSPPTAK